MKRDLNKVKGQILAALEHPEAQEGLYFRNFFHLHEEDERPAVEAEEVDILDALQELIHEGKIKMNQGGEDAVFHLAA